MNDLEHILARTGPLWDEIRGERLFVTGGSGFFGQWVVRSFAWLNETLKLNCELTVLARDPGAAAQKLVAPRGVHFHAGDITNFTFPEGQFSHILHMATPTSTVINQQKPLEMLDITLLGTRRVVEFAGVCGAKRVLLTSSGAVYGKHPPSIPLMPETYLGGPDPLAPNAAYGEGKRASETLLVAGARAHGYEAKIGRFYALVGPHLQMDAQYAVGNFILDGLRGDTIHIQSDGTPLRSYLYAADMVVWLWTILLKGKSAFAYNVGSSEPFSMHQIAEAVSEVFAAEHGKALKIEIAKKPTLGALPESYVPDVSRARDELGLVPWTSFRDGIAKTISWAKLRPNDLF